MLPRAVTTTIKGASTTRSRAETSVVTPRSLTRVRRGSPYTRLSSRISSLTTARILVSLDNRSCNRPIRSMTSLYSSCTRRRSRAASRRNWRSRIACACASLKLKRLQRFSRAVSAVRERRIVSITSSRWSSAISKPSRT